MNTISFLLAMGVISLVAVVSYLRYRRELKQLREQDSYRPLNEDVPALDEFAKRKIKLPSGRLVSDMELLLLTKRDLKNMCFEDVKHIALYSRQQSLNKKPQFDGLYIMAYDILKR